MKALKKAKYVAMDTEFPGIVYKADPKTKEVLDQYGLVFQNCNKLNLIQLGFALADEHGKLVDQDSVW